MTALLVLGLATSGLELLGTPPDELQDRRWSLGVQFGALDLPSGHLGIPLGLHEDDAHLAAALVGRYQLAPNAAIDVGAGLPTSAMGPALWGSFELLLRPWSVSPVLAIEIYEASGLQLGFAGPDYFARTENEFVGYAYAFGGPATFALRLPIGLRLCWWRDRFETYVEGSELLTFTPSVESLFSLAVGIRIHW